METEIGKRSGAMVILNISLFIVGSFLGWLFLATYIKNRQLSHGSLYTKKSLAAFGVSALLFMPFNIGGNIFTTAGNARTDGSIYSVFSVYQHAEKNAFALVNIGYQRAGENAVQFFGVAYQNANNTAQVFGIAYQNAGKDIMQTIGVAYQNAGHSALQFIGVAYQNSNEIAFSLIGAVYQSASTDAKQGLGVAYQKAGKTAAHGIGVAIRQYSDLETKNYAGVALWQQVGNKNKAFAVWSVLKADRTK